MFVHRESQTVRCLTVTEAVQLKYIHSIQIRLTNLHTAIFLLSYKYCVKNRCIKPCRLYDLVLKYVLLKRNKM